MFKFGIDLNERAMLFGNTNIELALKKSRSKNAGAEAVLRESYKILKDVSANRTRIAQNISGKQKHFIEVNFDFDLLDMDKIFHLEQIREICIDYRLRFLDSKYFKGDIPPEAISKINRLEKDHSIEIKNFKIIAPSKLFKLNDKDDPLLFAPMGNDYFYLIHKWGNDLHPFRRLLMWPFKSIVNLTLLVFLISYLMTSLVPEGLFSKTNTNAEFWIIYFFMFKSIASMVIFYGFALGKNFNPAIWNSKYFNT